MTLGESCSHARFSGRRFEKADLPSFAAFLSTLMSWLGTNASQKETEMTQAVGKVKLYTVVEVWRGMAVGAKSFRLRSAEKHLQRLRRRRNLLEDDVQLFKDLLHVSI